MIGIQIIVFGITMWLFISDYKKGKVTLKKWLWWIIIPFFWSLIIIPFWGALIRFFDDDGVRFINLSLLLCLSVQLAVLIIYLIKREESSKKTMSDDVNVTCCPYCKNPNTKKLQVCEWCGNEIY